jgi:hypothetical protein
MKPRVEAAATGATAAPVYPTEYVRRDRDGRDDDAVTVAAVLHVRRHGLAGGPTYPVERALAAASQASQ